MLTSFFKDRGDNTVLKTKLFEERGDGFSDLKVQSVALQSLT